MEVITALSLEIGHRHQPVVTSYQLGCMVFQLYAEKIYRGEALKRIQKDVPDRARYNELAAGLVKSGVLQHSKDVPSKEVYAVLGQDTAAAEDVACCIAPSAINPT